MWFPTIKLARKVERAYQNKNSLLEKIWSLNSSFWKRNEEGNACPPLQQCKHHSQLPLHLSLSSQPGCEYLKPCFHFHACEQAGTNSTPGNRRSYAYAMFTWNEIFDEHLANKYSSHWNTICEFFSSFMKNWKLLEKNKWAISHNSSLLTLVSCFTLLCMVENLLKNALYYWPSTFWKWFCHPSSS